MSAILNKDPPAVSQITPSVPPGLQRIVNRCLSKSPEQRIQDATDLAFALEALSDSSSVTSSGLERPAAARRWIWVAAGFALIAIAAGLVICWKLPAAVPVVVAVTPLTDDGLPKDTVANLATDGPRIYFNEGEPNSFNIAQIAAKGGPTANLSVRLPQRANSSALSGRVLYPGDGNR